MCKFVKNENYTYITSSWDSLPPLHLFKYAKLQAQTTYIVGEFLICLLTRLDDRWSGYFTWFFPDSQISITHNSLVFQKLKLIFFIKRKKQSERAPPPPALSQAVPHSRNNEMFLYTLIERKSILYLGMKLLNNSLKLYWVLTWSVMRNWKSKKDIKWLEEQRTKDFLLFMMCCLY